MEPFSTGGFIEYTKHRIAHTYMGKLGVSEIICKTSAMVGFDCRPAVRNMLPMTSCSVNAVTTGIAFCQNSNLRRI